MSLYWKERAVRHVRKKGQRNIHQGSGVEAAMSDQSLDLFLHVLGFRVALNVVVSKAYSQS